MPWQVSLARVLCDNVEDMEVIQPLAMQVRHHCQQPPDLEPPDLEPPRRRTC